MCVCVCVCVCARARKRWLEACARPRTTPDTPSAYRRDAASHLILQPPFELSLYTAQSEVCARACGAAPPACLQAKRAHATHLPLLPPPATQVATLASAFASLQHPDPALLAALSRVAMRSDVLRTMTSEHAATILRSFQALGCLEAGLATCLRPVVARGGRGLAGRPAAGLGVFTPSLRPPACLAICNLA